MLTPRVTVIQLFVLQDPDFWDRAFGEVVRKRAEDAQRQTDEDMSKGRTRKATERYPIPVVALTVDAELLPWKCCLSVGVLVRVCDRRFAPTLAEPPRARKPASARPAGERSAPVGEGKFEYIDDSEATDEDGDADAVAVYMDDVDVAGDLAVVGPDGKVKDRCCSLGCPPVVLLRPSARCDCSHCRRSSA